MEIPTFLSHISQLPRAEVCKGLQRRLVAMPAVDDVNVLHQLFDHKVEVEGLFLCHNFLLLRGVVGVAARQDDTGQVGTPLIPLTEHSRADEDLQVVFLLLPRKPCHVGFVRFDPLLVVQRLTLDGVRKLGAHVDVATATGGGFGKGRCRLPGVIGETNLEAATATTLLLLVCSAAGVGGCILIA